MPKGNGKNLPATRDAGCAVRKWYRERSVEAMAGQVTMLQAMTELHYTALAHLMRQMSAPSTGKHAVSDAVKTQIALAMSPRLNAEFRGKMRDRDGARAPQGTSEAGGSLMDAYRVRVGTGSR